MLGFFKLAIRNVWRNKRRSIITVTAIGMGLTLVLFLSGVFSGMEERMVEGVIKMNGYFQIHSKGYNEKSRLLPLDISIGNPDEVVDKLKSISYIDCVAPRIKFGAIVSSGNNSFGVMCIGINPHEEDKINIPLKRISDGKGLDNNGGYAVIGKRMAQDLNLRVGSILTIVSNTMYGAMNAIDLEIKGIIDSGYPQYDSSMVFMTVEDAQKLLDMKNRITDVVVSIFDTNKTDYVLKIIKQQLKNSDIEIQSWKEMGESVWRTQKMWKIFSNIINIAVILVAILGVINTLLMSVSERTREVGTIMAMGTTRIEISVLFILEGFVLGLIGGIIGGILGGLAIQYLATVGISLKGSSASGLTVIIGETIYGKFSWPFIILSFIAAQIVAVTASLYPAYIASKQEPVDALRHT